ncbi:unnamed protein product [Closterium sp. Yama58-4]|nr:unnamed protein product [Closterium sp. Yama58-4]
MSPKATIFNTSEAACDAYDAGDDADECTWASLPPELLRDVIARVEASDSSWPGRRSVVAFEEKEKKQPRSGRADSVRVAPYQMHVGRCVSEMRDHKSLLNTAFSEFAENQHFRASPLSRFPHFPPSPLSRFPTFPLPPLPRIPPFPESHLPPIFPRSELLQSQGSELLQSQGSYESSGQITFPDELRMPGPRDRCVECFIRRSRKTGTFTLFLGVPPNSTENGKFLLAARKCGWRPSSMEYVVSLDPKDFSRGGSSFVGRLRANFLSTRFAVFESSHEPAFSLGAASLAHGGSSSSSSRKVHPRGGALPANGYHHHCSHCSIRSGCSGASCSRGGCSRSNDGVGLLAAGSTSSSGCRGDCNCNGASVADTATSAAVSLSPSRSASLSAAPSASAAPSPSASARALTACLSRSANNLEGFRSPRLPSASAPPSAAPSPCPAVSDFASPQFKPSCIGSPFPGSCAHTGGGGAGGGSSGGMGGGSGGGSGGSGGSSGPVVSVAYALNVLGVRGPRRILCTLHQVPAGAAVTGGGGSGGGGAGRAAGGKAGRGTGAEGGGKGGREVVGKGGKWGERAGMGGRISGSGGSGGGSGGGGQAGSCSGS